jgi:hypothetical protein
MVAMPTPLVERKATSGTTANAKGGPGSPESLAQGMFPKGFSMNPGELAIYLHYVLDEWFENEVKPRLRGEAHEIRFADGTPVQTSN